MNFLHLFRKDVEFGNIEGFDDIKDIYYNVGKAAGHIVKHFAASI